MKRASPRNIWKTIRKDSIPAMGDDFWEDLSSLVPIAGPRTDSYTDHGQVVTIMELPGVATAERLQLSLRGHTLHLRGEIPYLYPVDEVKLTMNERFTGTFHRQIELPKSIDPRGVRAKLEFGLLTVTVPLMEERELAVPIDDMCGRSDEVGEKGELPGGQVHVSGSAHSGSEQIVGGIQRTQSADPLEKQSKNQ